LLLERPTEPAARLPVEDTIYLRQHAEAPATARAQRDLRALLQNQRGAEPDHDRARAL
jgi:hypothetical protein